MKKLSTVLALSILTAAASCAGVPDPSSSADNGSGGGSLPGGSTVPGPGPGGSSAGNPVGDIAFVGGQMVEGASCDSVGGEVVVGNGDIVDRPRPVTGFTKLRQESVLTTVVSQASGFAVSVRTDSNLQDIVTATVVDGTLVLSASKSFCTRTLPSATIVLPRLEAAALIGVGDLSASGMTGAASVALALSGVGDLTFSGQSTALSLDVSGVGMVTLAGKTDQLKVTASGIGDIDAAGLASVDATVAASGVGNIKINASRNATITADCIGEIEVSGGAKAASGAGDLCQVRSR
jgi:Putative auto-transporter adhesin, head GIN domain